MRLYFNQPSGIGTPDKIKLNYSKKSYICIIHALRFISAFAEMVCRDVEISPRVSINVFFPCDSLFQQLKSGDTFLFCICILSNELFNL